MAYIQHTTLRETLIDSALAAFRSIGARIEKRRTFVRTRNELSGLSDYSLADLGLTRGEINRVAMETSIRSSHH